MRAAILVAALLILLGTRVTGTPQAVSTVGTIEGVVTRADTGEPLTGARVTLVALSAAAAASAQKIPMFEVQGGTLIVMNPTAAVAVGREIPGTLPPATTPGDGRFLFKDLSPGTYRLSAAANDYVTQEYGQRGVNGLGRPLYLSAGQTIKDASIALMPTGVISGRIWDETGQPAIGVPVQLVRSTYNAQGRALQSAGTTNANDRGEYRLFGVPPGRYYLSVGTPPGPPGGSPSAPSPVPGARYAMTYYPGVADVSGAAQIEVSPGAEVRLDLTTKRQQAHRIRGRVIDSRTGQAPPAVTFWLGYRSVSGAGFFSSGRGYDPVTGVFELQDLNSGSYTIQAQLSAPGASTKPGLPTLASMAGGLGSGLVPIKVEDADIEGIVLTLSTGVTVSGQIQVEGQPLSSVSGLGSIRMNLRVPPTLTGPTGTATSQVPDADGNFRIEGVREGEYTAAIGGVPQGYYVSSAEYGGDDVLGKVFKVSESGPGKFEITLRKGTGQIAGLVTGSRSEPVPGVQVALIPDQRNRTDLYRSMITDQNGGFTMTGLTPGMYTLFSWEAGEWGGYFDPEILKQHEQQGRSVRIAESSSETVDIRIIPAP